MRSAHNRHSYEYTAQDPEFLPGQITVMICNKHSLNSGALTMLIAYAQLIKLTPNTQQQNMVRPRCGTASLSIQPKEENNEQIGYFHLTSDGMNQVQVNTH